MTGTRTDWIAVDWGTTHLRAWAMDRDDKVLDRATSDDGMGRLGRSDFEPALMRLVENWLGPNPTNVMACGMVGSRQGWAEAPYRAVPCTPLGDATVQVPSQCQRLRVYIVQGLKQENPADVMRGEETQIAGFLAAQPEFDGVLCLPGTHTKWAQISAGEVVSFQTYMTGELFSTLAETTVLRHSVKTSGWDCDAFIDALGDSLSRPERLAARLFGLRAQGLLQGQSAETARARLSGLLIGAELAAARPYWLGQRVALLGAPALTDRYAEALKLQGLQTETADAEAMTLAGLIRANDQERAHS